MVIIARDKVREPLYAIVPYFNPWRWKSRVKHTERAIKHFHDSGAVIVLVEVGFNRREFEFSESGLNDSLATCELNGGEFRHKHIGLRTKDELWLKENAINIGVQSLPHDWKQICWLDSDVHFARPNWVGETIHKLQHGTTSDRAFLQMFSQARDLGPNYEMLDEDYPHASGLGFIYAWQKGFVQSTPNPFIEADIRTLRKDTVRLERDFHREQAEKIHKDIKRLKKDVNELEKDFEYPPYGDKRVFPGLAWACTRPAFEAVSGLFETAIWGGGDWHMSHALIEKTEGMMRNDLHRNYKKLVMQWYQRCRTHIRQNVLVMEGAIFHHWHGKKIGRGYNAKHALLAKVGFDPLRHLTKDYQGLFQLHDDRSTAYVQLRDVMRTLARERNEDSIDI